MKAYEQYKGQDVKTVVLALVADGMDLAEALDTAGQICKKDRAPIMTVTERKAHIDGLTSLEDLKKARKQAASKKSRSKSRGDSVGYKKYSDEYNYISSKITEIRGTIGHSVVKAAELGVDIGTQVQMFIDNYSTEVDAQLERVRLTTNLSKRAMKEKLNKEDPATPRLVRNELRSTAKYQVYEDRVAKGDQRLVQLNKKIRLLARI